MSRINAVATQRRQQLVALTARLERLYAIAALVVFSGALVPIIEAARGQSLDMSRGDWLMQAIILPIFLLAAFLLVLDLKRSVRTTARIPLTLLLVCLAVASSLWSTLPELTLRRSLALGGTTLFGIYLVVRYDERTRLHLLACALTITLVGCILVALLLPEYGTTGQSLQAQWRGVFTDKNTFGRVMVLSAALFLVKASDPGKLRWLLWLFAGAAGYLVFRSQSATAVVVLISVVLLLPFYLSLRLHYSRFVLVAIWAVLIGALAGLFVIAHSEQILTQLGRDPTLTGRTDLWEAVLSFIRERIWFGYGYSAFWTGWSGPAGDIWSAVSWEPPHSHNGVLDLWLDLGLVAVSICVLDIVLSIRRSVGAAVERKGSADLWGLVFWTILVLSNVSESTLLRQNSLFWVLYVMTVAGAGQGLRQRLSAVALHTGRGRPLSTVSPTNHPLVSDSAALSLGLRRRAIRRLRDRASE